MKLSGERLPDVADPTWEVVEIALWSMSEDGNAFVILDRGDATFLQTCGSVDSLIIEWKMRAASNEDVQYRLARKGILKIGRPSADASELDVTDALICFSDYFSTGKVPPHYALLEVDPATGAVQENPGSAPKE